MAVAASVLTSGYAAVRPLLFRAGGGDPEEAHHRTLSRLAGLARHPRLLSVTSALLAASGSAREVFGLRFPSAVGLAAGMDKDGTALRAWPALGFGFTEVGTVTAQPQPGNEKPRLFRLRASRALVNRMGFNNAGAEALAARLEAAGTLPTPLGISIGKSKAAPVEHAVEDYLTSLRLLAGYAGYIAVNVSSPNTPGLRSLQDRGPLSELLGALVGETRVLAGPGGRPVPVLVKIAPDLTDDAIADVLQVCADTGIAGVIATNTTLARDGVAETEAALAAEAGGLSGAPLTLRARHVVSFVSRHAGLPVIGVGGIMAVDDGIALLDAGASLLQLYTGFIYAGPGLVRGLDAEIGRRDAGGGPESRPLLDEKS